jgi:hypothetical protein
MSIFKTHKLDQAVANDYLQQNQPCNRCNGSTQVEDLMSFGARCRGCYEAYLAEANPPGWPNRKLTPDERAVARHRGIQALEQLRAMRTDPKAWARNLQQREEAGEVLTPIQSQAWKEALKPRMDLEVTA